MGGGEQTHPKNLDKPIKRVHKNLNRGVCVGGDVACLKPITSFHYSFPYFHFNFLHGPKKVWGGVCWQLRYNVLFVNVIKCLLQQKSVDKPPPPSAGPLMLHVCAWVAFYKGTYDKEKTSNCLNS